MNEQRTMTNWIFAPPPPCWWLRWQRSRLARRRWLRRFIRSMATAQAQRAEVETFGGEGYARPREVMHIKVCT
jgi:hypothetical protein